MPIQRHHVEGYENFCAFIEKLDKTVDSKEQPIFLYFTGSKEATGPFKGQSWCDDCRDAWPIVQMALEKADSKWHFVYIEVGDRKSWKDPKCPFRTDRRTRLMVVPTMLKWKTAQRLEGGHLTKAELIELMYEHDDED